MINYKDNKDSLVLFSLAALTLAMMYHWGEYELNAIAILVGALVLMGLTCLAKDTKEASKATWLFTGGALSISISYFLILMPFINYPVLACLILLGFVGSMALKKMFLKKISVGFTFVLVLIANLLPFLLIAWGHGLNDTFFSLQNASQALIQGHNPYTPSTPFIYEYSVDHFGIRNLHFPYGPTIALLIAPFRLLGDVKIAFFVASVILALVIVYLSNKHQGSKRTYYLALLCLVMPYPIAMVQMTWTDVFTVLLFTAWIAFREKHPRWAIFMLLLCLAAKPTIAIAFVPFFLWSAKARKEILLAALGAILLILPFALATGFYQFYYNVLGIQIEFLPRYDALTLASLTHNLWGFTLPNLLTTALTGLIGALILLKKPTDYMDILVRGAFVTACSLFLAKWAFFNYYYIAAMMLILALALRNVPIAAADDITLPFKLEVLLNRYRSNAIGSHIYKYIYGPTETV